jgi:serine-type D-Ala-D-Ala carboxypeptidase (penicillin-binding protein 5/6)
MGRRPVSRRTLLQAALGWAALAAAGRSRAADDPFSTAASAYLVKVDDTVLWAGRAGERRPPASLTKIMSALLAIERGGLNETVTVSAHAAAAHGTRLGLRRGERITAADLLAATVIRSANDACRALAEWHSGSEAAFVQRMNARAGQLGLADTRFANACGFDASGHYASARDLASLSETALADPHFSRLARTVKARARTAGGRDFLFETTNALLGRLPGTIGVKSGYTSKAGQCIAAAAERDGVRVLLVMLDAHNRWWDAHGMMERAFALSRP